AGGKHAGHDAGQSHRRASEQGAEAYQDERHRELHRIGDVRIGSGRDEMLWWIPGKGRASAASIELEHGGSPENRRHRQQLGGHAYEPERAIGERTELTASSRQDDKRENP